MRESCLLRGGHLQHRHEVYADSKEQYEDGSAWPRWAVHPNATPFHGLDSEEVVYSRWPLVSKWLLAMLSSMSYRFCRGTDRDTATIDRRTPSNRGSGMSNAAGTSLSDFQRRWITCGMVRTIEDHVETRSRLNRRGIEMERGFTCLTIRKILRYRSRLKYLPGHMRPSRFGNRCRHLRPVSRCKRQECRQWGSR
jgi:hypothetical protein